MKDVTNKIQIKKADTVAVLAGKDINKQGKVLYVFPKKKRVVVEGVNFIKRHTRGNPQRGVQSGVITREASIHLSNVMLVCPKCNRPSRFGKTILNDGSKVRVCKKCHEILEKK